MIDDEVRLVLPADAAYGRVARITASSLALRLGLSFHRIDDLRLAIDEALVLLLRGEPDDGSITVSFTVGAQALLVDLVGSAGADPVAGPDEERFAELVAAIVDGAELRDGGRAVHLEALFEPAGLEPAG